MTSSIIASISAIPATIICCLVSPLITSLPIGIGALIFKYEVLPGSLSDRLLSVCSGFLGGLIVFKAYAAFDFMLPWWSFLIPAILFMIIGAKPETDINGRSLSFGATIGLFIFLLLRWIA